MATTPAQLVSQVNTELRVNTSSKIWNTSTILGYINQAIRRVEIDMRLESNANAPASSSTSTVAGTIEYALPSDFAEMDMVQLNNGGSIFTLYPIEYQQTKLLNPNDTQGLPSQYYIRGSNIGLYQPPNGVYTLLLFYKKLVTSLSIGGANLELNDVYTPSIVKYAAYLAWSSIKGAEQTAEAKKQQYLEEVGIQQARILAQDPNGMNFVSDRKRYSVNNFANWARSLWY